jgi:hypothetical protein
MSVQQSMLQWRLRGVGQRVRVPQASAYAAQQLELLWTSRLRFGFDVGCTPTGSQQKTEEARRPQSVDLVVDNTRKYQPSQQTAICKRTQVAQLHHISS